MRVFIIMYVPVKEVPINNDWPWWDRFILKQRVRRVVLKAENKEKAIEEFYRCHGVTDHSNYKYLHIIATVEKEPDYVPFNEEFKKENWMKWE